MPIEIKLIARDQDELSRQIAALVPLMNNPPHLDTLDSSVDSVVRGPEGEPLAEVVLPEGVDVISADEAPGPGVAAAPRVRGRPRKDSETVAAPKVPNGAPPADDPPVVVAPEKLREEAIALLRSVFSRAPKGQSQIKSLQQKFSVAKFIDVPLDRAAELLADAKAADLATA